MASPQDLLVLEEQEVETDKDTQLFSNYSLSLLLQNQHFPMYLLTCVILQGSVNFKFGVLYAKEGQLTDDEMFSNGKFLSVPYWQLVGNLCASLFFVPS